MTTGITDTLKIKTLQKYDNALSFLVLSSTVTILAMFELAPDSVYLETLVKMVFFLTVGIFFTSRMVIRDEYMSIDKNTVFNAFTRQIFTYIFLVLDGLFVFYYRDQQFQDIAIILAVSLVASNIIEKITFIVKYKK